MGVDIDPRAAVASGAGGPADVPERLVELSSVFNMRDLGGYPTTSGQVVRWRRLFRADGLHRLDDADRLVLGELGIRTVIDLRRPEEVADRRFTMAGVAYHNASLQPEVWDPAAYDPTVGAARYLADRYLEMAELRGAELGSVLRLIAGGDDLPLAFHCLAGKDRTGVVAAVTLSLLGVPDELIAEDYSLSAGAVARWQAWFAEQHPEALANATAFPEPWRVSPPEAITLFLADLRAAYGDVSRYAAEVGVDAATVDAMRRSLLTTA